MSISSKENTVTSSCVQQINVYPVKSIAGLSLSSAWVDIEGLSFDRRFMVGLSDGAMATGRQFPQMVHIKSCLLSDGLVFSYPNKPSLTIHYSEFSMQTMPAKVWGDRFPALQTTSVADKWFSDILGQPVNLLYCGEQSQRIRPKLGHSVSFADGYPLLLISQASLDELNRRSPIEHSMAQFRTNLVASGDVPFIEDSWKTIKIGEVIFDIVKPCQRCIFTTIDLKNAAFRKNSEPLTTLSQFRSDKEGRLFFGQNLVAKNTGMIHQGDEIEVLEYQQAIQYN